VTRGTADLVPRLHVVTDDETLARADFVKTATSVLEAAATAPVGKPSGAPTRTMALHVRGPRSSGRRIHELVLELHDIARANGALLVVNDRVDVALTVQGVGIHLGVRSLPVREVRALVDRPLGMSIHAAEGASSARLAGADWVLAGHVFETPSHPRVAARGTGWLREVACPADALPTLGIGGITGDRVAEVLESGAIGIGVLSGIWNAPDPVDAVLGYIEALNA
jgi:thiamine-phosphate diphosphorylase